MIVDAKNNLLVDGLLLVDKPQDWTSHDVCHFVRRHFGIKKVGHAGTLDPLATGLLVLLLGKATKMSNEFSSLDKAYEGVMELGVKTDSHDRQGKMIEEKEMSHITPDMIDEKAKAFMGDIMQVPPMVSALKHKGTRLYKLARKGQEVERKPRPVRVYEFRFFDKKDQFVPFYAKVSKGTYVRTLVNDLGEALQSCATLASLRRLQIGFLNVAESLTVDELRQLTPSELREKTIPLSKANSYVSHQPSSVI